MVGDLLFPASVIVIKLVVKLVVGQEFKIVDMLKALIAFPLDIAFMALSFGAAILFIVPIERVGLKPLNFVGFYIVVSLIASMIVAASCKHTDLAFSKEQWAKGIALAGSNYGAALLMLAFCMNLEGYIK